MFAGSVKAWFKARRDAHRRRLARQPDVSGNARRIVGASSRDPGDITGYGGSGGGGGF